MTLEVGLQAVEVGLSEPVQRADDPGLVEVRNGAPPVQKQGKPTPKRAGQVRDGRLERGPALVRGSRRVDVLGARTEMLEAPVNSVVRQNHDRTLTSSRVDATLLVEF